MECMILAIDHVVTQSNIETIKLRACIALNGFVSSKPASRI